MPEVFEATRLFCGSAASSSYMVTLSLSLGGSVWAYAILFGQSLTSVIPIFGSSECSNGDTSGECQTRYYFFLFMLGCISTPLSLMDMKDQAAFQVFICFMMVTLICVMSITCIMAYLMDDMQFCFPGSYAEEDESDDSADLNFSLIMVSCISASVFSLFLNSGVPVVAQALADKSKLLTVLSRALGGACVLFGVWATILSVSFGHRVDNPSNLNWGGYRLPQQMTPDASSLLYPLVVGISDCIEYMVVLFPALDVLSVYPLTSVVLSNNILEALFDPSPAPRSPGASTGTEVYPWHERFRSQIELTIRIMINLLPIVGAAITPNFLFVVNYVGGVSALICFVFPAMLSMYHHTVVPSPSNVVPLKNETPITSYGAIDSGAAGEIGGELASEEQLLLPHPSAPQTAKEWETVDLSGTLLEDTTVKHTVFSIGVVLFVLIITGAVLAPS